MARLVSVNVSEPRKIVYKGRTILTGIFKEPVEGKIRLRKLNLDGDRQADLKVHGGVDKAVYAYPHEHYGFWKSELPEIDFNPGQFGENFTTEGLLEQEVFVGDRFHVGSAEVQVTQPRMPCYKLGAKFGRDDIIKRFLQSRRSGFYFSVVEEGEVERGDEMVRVNRVPDSISIHDIVELYVRPHAHPDLLLRAINLEPLPESWREFFAAKLNS